MANAATEAASHGEHNHGDGHGHGMHEGRPWLQHHFDTPQQQFDTAKLGMWVFIVTEILMFGGLFVGYFIFHSMEPEVFHHAARELNRPLGAVNTIVLLFSSLTAALAVRSSQLGKKSQTTMWLVITILCAGAFLVVKYFEYTHKFEHGLLPGRCFGYVNCGNQLYEHTVHHLAPRSNMFFALYFMTTGLHAIHIIIGMSVLTWVLVRNMRGEFSAEYFTPVEIGALYWHLVDLVWIYLFPLLYLVG